jgi:hypothetical protein
VIERVIDAAPLRPLTRRGSSRKNAVRSLTALLVIFAAIAPMAHAAAQDAASKTKPPAATPLPPTRPVNVGGSATSPDVPQTSATPMAPQTAPSTALQTQVPAPPPAASQAPTPPEAPATRDATWKAGATGPLPPASRQRIHACGLEWEKMKLAGQTIDKSWRDFAEVCLTR